MAFRVYITDPFSPEGPVVSKIIDADSYFLDVRDNEFFGGAVFVRDNSEIARYLVPPIRIEKIDG